MANIDIWALRITATKQLIGWSRDSFDLQGGQEQVQENVPEEDEPIFGTKYRFNSGTGDLEINGKTYYLLEFSDDAVAFSPDGIPQVDVGGQDSFNLTIDKKDVQGNSHTAAGDDDTLFVTAINGKVDVNSVDLVNGQAVVEVFSGLVRGTSTIKFEMDDIQTITFEFQTV